VLKLTLARLLARSYASWQAPGSTEIRVSSLVVGGISTEVLKGFDAIPQSGRRAEVGGILLGRSGENEIVVDDFEPVLCEHRFGPSFRLSDSDRIAWRETVQRIRQREEFAIVGWYRTDTREEFALSEDDRELLETELHQDGDVILLIKPTQSQPYEAKLFIGDDGQSREVPQATYFAFDRRASSLLRPSSAELLVKRGPTARTETPFSGIEQQLWNPTKDSEFFDPGNDSTSREVASAASVEHDGPQSPSARRAAAGEPKESVPTSSDERKLEYFPPTQPALEDGDRTASVPREGEPVCFADPPLLPGKAPESRSEFEPIGPLARRRFLAQQPPEERKSRKLNFIIGAMLLAAMCGTLGYYLVRTRPAAPASRRLAQQAPVPPSTSQTAPALQPAQASAVQPAETKPTVQPPNATEYQPLAADTDRQVRLFLLKWADAEKSTNIDDVGDFYAPKMSRYFTKRGVTRANVRAARAKDYARYGRMIVCDIKNISVNPVDSGHAVATFRKRWQTAGPRVLMGEEQEQLTLMRDQGRWQIGAEQRTKLYWMRKEHYDPVSRRTARAAR
jgi:hypothetical protein